MASTAPYFHYVYVAGTGAVCIDKPAYSDSPALTGRGSKVGGTVISQGKSSSLQVSLMIGVSPS